MSSITLSKYRDLIPVNDENKTLAILSEIAELPADKAKEHFAQSRIGGGVYLYGSPKHPEYIVEYVPGHRAADSVSTLYHRGSSYLASPQVLLKAREEIISDIAAIIGALPSVIGFHDAGRGRDTVLNEMGTAQLIDALCDATNTDLATV